MDEEGHISPVDPELRCDFIWQQAPWPTHSFSCFYSMAGANSLLTIDPFVFPAEKQQNKQNNPATLGHHI